MSKKVEKVGLVSIIIFSLIIIATIIICIAKPQILKTSSQTPQTRAYLDQTQIESQNNLQNASTQQNDGSITYNTSGNDSANYEDGNTSGKKSEWVKNGDTWQYTFYVDDPDAQWYVYEDSNSLMEGYTADYTEYNAGTLFNEETLQEFTPTENMKQSTNSSGKKVYTWLDTENSYKVIENGDGTYTKITTKLSFTVTNYNIDSQNSVYYGNLVINKIVKNSEGTEVTENEDPTNFVFTITLSASGENQKFIEGTKTFSDIVFKNGVATVSLKAGGSITISNIPEGITYTVTEREVDGYTTTFNSNTGTIVKDTDSKVICTNQKNPQPSEGTGTGGGQTQTATNVTLKKLVTGNYEIEQNYNFEISMSNLKQYTTYNLSNGISFTSDSNGTANVAVTLKNNESVVLQNIPIGSKYKVYEYAGDYVSSYVITDNNNAGLINNSSNNNTKQNTALSTNTETADEGEDIVITFTNEKQVTQNLKLIKQVTDEEDKNSYIFTIEFANMTPGTSFNTTFGKITADETGKAEATIYLAGGEEAEAYDVPVGTTYKITELASSAIASYNIVDLNGGLVDENDANKVEETQKNNANEENGVDKTNTTDELNGTDKIVKRSNANTKNKTPLSTEVETVNEGEEAVITFVNDIVNQEPDTVSVSLGVIKNVLNKNGAKYEECEETFTFELTAEEESPMPESKTITIKGNGTQGFGTITFTQTGTYTYKIKELSEEVPNYKYDTSEYTIVYEVTNEQGLLEVTKTVKKDGFNSDVIEFVNTYIEPEKPQEPEDSQNQPTDEIKGENSSEQNEQNETEKVIEYIKENIVKTGDYIIIYAVVIVLAGVVLFVVWRRKNSSK